MKTAIVTGASGNLGQAVVKKFLDEGYHVVGTIHHDKAKTNFNHIEYKEVIVDLSNEDDAKKFVETVIAKRQTIDVAVLTAGGFAMGKIAETKSTDVLKQYKLNFETAYNIARPVFVQMIQQNSGRIFFIGSRPGLDAKNGKGMVAYSLSKSLLFHFAELMNDEGKWHNVVAGVIVPSTIDTPQNRQSMPDAKFENWVKPEEIANVVYFYTTSEATVIREPVIKIYSSA